ncbi:MAG: hypothetical protein AVDCRST_MAG27-3121, partial [uncultured Craurococcus sp.]
ARPSASRRLLGGLPPRPRQPWPELRADRRDGAPRGETAGRWHRVRACRRRGGLGHRRGSRGFGPGGAASALCGRAADRWRGVPALSRSDVPAQRPARQASGRAAGGGRPGPGRRRVLARRGADAPQPQGRRLLGVAVGPVPRGWDGAGDRGGCRGGRGRALHPLAWGVGLAAVGRGRRGRLPACPAPARRAVRRGADGARPPHGGIEL